MRVKMKYDCSRILEYVREKHRMCKTYLVCRECPLGTLDIDCTCIDDTKQDFIDIVQRWSDEHPEQPKLTKKEREFLNAFPYSKGMLINRTNIGLKLVIHRFIDSEPYICIDENMFPFIDEGEEWDFDKLFSLEVEE